MQPHSPTTRPGFTLVELLMVIIIIGILAGLLIVAVGPAIGTANTAVVKAEINQLDVALNNYRDTYGSLPPTMFEQLGVFSGDPYDSALVDAKEADKVKRFERHIRKAFPRYRGTASDIDTIIQTGTEITIPSGGSYPVTECKLDDLDQAESLVFWLGGIPKIWEADTTTGTYEVELTGFSSDPNNPFLPEYDPPSGSGGAGTDFQSERTPTLFEFDTRRLVDSDKDGWPEYLPNTDGGADTPPLVYHDASSYGLLPFYPDILHPGVGTWGIARPYLIRYVEKGNALPQQGSFANSETFQIMSAGTDNQYSTTNGTLDVVLRRVPVYTEGKYYDLSNDTTFSTGNAAAIPGSITAEEFDNLTNFAESKLENEFNSGN